MIAKSAPNPPAPVPVPRPGWHGIPPSADRFVAPLQLEEPDDVVTEQAKALPIWVELEYSDGGRQTAKGFAMSWTPSAVYAQWVEFSRAREAWVRPHQCARRELAAENRRDR